MKIFLLCLAILFTAPVTFGQSAGEIVEGKNYKGIIFSADTKVRIIDTAIRWTPSKHIIFELENQLSSFMKRQSKKEIVLDSYCPSISKHLNKYIRQYVGYESNGKKMIYVNCFLYKKDNELTDNWQTDFIQIFDGCSNYWQIHYDINKKRFTGFSVNGAG